MKRFTLFAATLALTAAAATAQEKKAEVPDPFDFPAPRATHQDLTDAGIVTMVGQLGSPDFALRDAATRDLFAAGERSRAALAQAAGAGNVEAQKRVKRLLAWLDRAKALQHSNAKVMLRGYCHARTDKQDGSALGGFYQDPNSSKGISSGVKALAQADAVSLVARPTHLARWGTQYRGMQLWLVNRTGDAVAFAAQDSRLSIVAEAKDTDGAWKPIEYLPSSW